jgi:hypothetical protein
MIELAGRFADEHPVANALMMAGVVLLVIVLVVFARPIARAIHRLEMWVLRARGVADPEPPPGVEPPAEGGRRG